MIDFEQGVSTPENWFRQAWEMFESSKVLYSVLSAREPVRSERENYRKVGAMKGAMLLLGLAAENALKGALVHKSKPDLSRDRLDPRHFHEKAHDLNAIAKKLNLRLTDKQIELLNRLTMFVQWASKYQVPLTKSEHELADQRLKLNYPSDYHSVEALISDLQSNCGFDQITGWPLSS